MNLYRIELLDVNENVIDDDYCTSSDWLHCCCIGHAAVAAGQADKFRVVLHQRGPWPLVTDSSAVTDRA